MPDRVREVMDGALLSAVPPFPPKSSIADSASAIRASMRVMRRSFCSCRIRERSIFILTRSKRVTMRTRKLIRTVSEFLPRWPLLPNALPNHRRSSDPTSRSCDWLERLSTPLSSSLPPWDDPRHLLSEFPFQECAKATLENVSTPTMNRLVMMGNLFWNFIGKKIGNKTWNCTF